jgi:hypothetical protein
VAASFASTISVNRTRASGQLRLALEASRPHEMTSADVLANYPKVPSAHSLVAGQSFPGFVRVECFTRRGCHAIALKTDDRGEAQGRDPNWHLVFILSASRSRPLEGRITFLTRNLAALEKCIPVSAARDEHTGVRSQRGIVRNRYDRPPLARRKGMNYDEPQGLHIGLGENFISLVT